MSILTPDPPSRETLTPMADPVTIELNNHKVLACMAEAGFPLATSLLCITEDCDFGCQEDCGWPVICIDAYRNTDREEAAWFAMWKAFRVAGCPDTPDCFLCFIHECDEHYG